MFACAAATASPQAPSVNLASQGSPGGPMPLIYALKQHQQAETTLCYAALCCATAADCAVTNPSERTSNVPRDHASDVVPCLWVWGSQREQLAAIWRRSTCGTTQSVCAQIARNLSYRSTLYALTWESFRAPVSSGVVGRKPPGSAEHSVGRSGQYPGKRLELGRGQQQPLPASCRHCCNGPRLGRRPGVAPRRQW